MGLLRKPPFDRFANLHVGNLRSGTGIWPTQLPHTTTEIQRTFEYRLLKLLVAQSAWSNLDLHTTLLGQLSQFWGGIMVNDQQNNNSAIQYMISEDYVSLAAVLNNEEIQVPTTDLDALQIQWMHSWSSSLTIDSRCSVPATFINGQQLCTCWL
jgi:hypothetical protein